MVSINNKLDYLASVTNLILTARRGDKAEAGKILRELYYATSEFESAYSSGQYKFLERLQKRYDIDIISPNESSVPNDEVPISVDDFVNDVRSGISLVTCAMNRTENLLKALPTWLDTPEINQIIIVDWSSNKPIKDEIKACGFNDPRILIARVNDQSRWILSYAFNLGFRLASYDKILKTDADIKIGSDFFANNSLPKNAFLSGDWRTAEKGQEHINGFFLVRRDDLFAANGFNEYITTYGWDDDDIYFRLEQLGINRVRINTSGVFHIPHPDSLRIEINQQPKNALEEALSTRGTKIMANRFISSAMPFWDKSKWLLPFRIISSAEGYIEVSQDGQGYNTVPNHIKSDAEFYGILNFLSWTFDKCVFGITKKKLFALLENRINVSSITNADIRLSCFSDCDEINWHRNLLIIRFEDGISGDDQAAIVRKIFIYAPIDNFTILIDSWLWDYIGENQAASGLLCILPIPVGFNYDDLPVLNPDEISNFSDAFRIHPVFVTYFKHNLKIDSFLSSGNITKSSRDILYVDVQHGLGNRLRALASAMAIAAKTNRELKVIWKPDHHCECELGDLFQYDGIVFTEVTLEALACDEKYTYMELEPNSCKDFPIRLTNGKDVYIKTAYTINNEHSTWESENVALRSLKLSNEIVELVNTVPTKSFVAVHIRMEGAAGTDHNSYDAPDNWSEESHRLINEWRSKSDSSRFIHRLDQIICDRPDAQIFLASDSEVAYSKFLKHYGSRVNYLKRDLFDRSKRQIMFALVDAILLSRCEYMLGSTWSSFTELAQRLSETIRKVELSGVDF